jgi:hypothetical protein
MDLYYLATSLPALAELGSPPPVSLAAFAARVGGTPAEEPAGFVLLGEDLLQRDALLAGELTEPSPVFLTYGQIRGRDALPAFLTPDPDPAVGTDGDRVWEAYWRHGALVARRAGPFLAGWVRREVGLRNALAAHRARLLDLPFAPRPVAPELGQAPARYEDLLASWAAAPDPLAGTRILLRSCWAWVLEHRVWFSFTVDEVVAYAVQLVLLHHWLRQTSAGAAAPGVTAAEVPAS